MTADLRESIIHVLCHRSCTPPTPPPPVPSVLQRESYMLRQNTDSLFILFFFLMENN